MSDDLTAREALRHIRLEPAPRSALEEMVHQVELSWFGGRSTSEADYRRCRDAYRRLARHLDVAGETA